MTIIYSKNKFRFKRQSNGKGFSVSIRDEAKNKKSAIEGEFKPKWQYKDLNKKQVFIMEQDWNSCQVHLFKGETLACIGVPYEWNKKDFNAIFDFWMKEYLKGDQNSEVF